MSPRPPPKISLRHDLNWSRGNDQSGSTVQHQPVGKLVQQSLGETLQPGSSKPTQFRKPIEDRTGQLVTQEIVGKSQGELSSSDRTGQLVKEEEKRVLKSPDRTGQLVEGRLHKVQEDGHLKNRDDADKFILAMDGRLTSFDKMASEVTTVARTRSENDVVPMDVSVIKGKGGKGKDGKGKEGKGKEGKGKTKAKEDRDKFDSKSNPNKFKKCFYCDKVGHVRADCRKKKRDDEERRNMSPQNSFNASSASMSPPGLTNVTTNTSGASSSSLRQLTIHPDVSDEEFHSSMRIFVLRYNSNV